MTALPPEVADLVWLLANQQAHHDGSSSVSSSLVTQLAKGFREQPTSISIFLSSHSNYWYTPYSILNLAKQVLGTIDLDPCSDSTAQKSVRATKFYNIEQDGLAPCNPWQGNVYVNPPFGIRGGESVQGLFFHRTVAEYNAGNISAAICLLKASIGYKWFNAVLQHPHCLLSQRLAFHFMGQQDNQTNPHGSVVVYLGKEVTKFCSVFSAVGSIPGVSSWASSVEQSS